MCFQLVSLVVIARQLKKSAEWVIVEVKPGVLEDVCCVIAQWTACSMHHRVELEQSNNVSEHSTLKNSKTFPTDRSRVSGQGFLCCL